MKTASVSATGKRWILDDAISGSVESFIVQMLRKRGLQDKEEVNTSMDTRFPQMRKAAQRIYDAIAHKEVIAIFGDYDCDGITAAAQLVRFFERKGIQAILRLPHRERDGYGLNIDIIEELAAKNVKLILTVDTGITAIEEIQHAKEKGTDVIITDHHALPEQLPDAYAIVHPELSSTYPLPYPSGAGVAYQLVFALEEGQWEDKETDMVLAMLGTVADLVELKGANRRLVQLGLQSLSTTKYEPFRQLLHIAGIDQKRVTSTDVAFRIAPRINASGRIGDPLNAIDALLYGGDAVEKLDDLNRERQKQTQESMAQAIQNIDTEHPPPLLHILDEEYAHGIVGLIAGRLTEQFGRPSMVALLQDDVCIVSLRSPNCYHITEGLSRCQDLLERFGGHAQAAGCTLHKENWPELCKRLTEDIQSNTVPEDLQPTLLIDAQLELRTITTRLIENLNRLEPYGQGNREPLFLLKNVRLEEPRCVGADKSHLQCSIGGRKAIGFNLGALAHLCDEPLDIVCRIGLDTWKGAQAPQIMIVDVRRIEN